MHPRRIALALFAVTGLAGCAPAPVWEMPAVVGQNLQAAQDAVQELTGFAVRVTTHDLSGSGRTQVDDVDWLVCTQSPPAGAAVTRDSMVDLGVVRQGEGC